MGNLIPDPAQKRGAHQSLERQLQTHASTHPHNKGASSNRYLGLASLHDQMLDPLVLVIGWDCKGHGVLEDKQLSQRNKRMKICVLLHCRNL